ncbi:MAG: hypothetical protein AB1477_01690 [Acidobacteriota bacterium]|jgi:hypothetical protein
MGNGNKIALDTFKKLAQDKISSEAKDRIFMEVFSDSVKSEAAKDAGLKTFKSAFSYAALFISFVDNYSKAIAAANLENVRRNLEVCPHIGQLQGYNAAIQMASNTIATVWCAPDCYWYFHPQPNYRVRHARQILRTTEDGGWRIEWPGKSKWVLQDCWGCVEAHGG